MAGKGSVNKVIVVGNLGADPESRSTPSGLMVAKLSIATTDARKDKQSGQSVEETEWHRVTMFGKLAEISGQYLRKGAKVYVEGRLKTSKWQTQDGGDRYTTEIIANEMTMLGGRDQKPAQSQGYQQSAQSGSARGGDGFEDEALPF